MKKLQVVLAAAILMSITTAAAAQDPQPQGRGGGRGNMMAMLLQGITLTAEQQVKVDSINTKYQTERRALRQDESLDQDARRAKGREIMTKQSDEIKATLTDEQKKAFDKNQADMQARMQGGGRPPFRD